MNLSRSTTQYLTKRITKALKRTLKLGLACACFLLCQNVQADGPWGVSVATGAGTSQIRPLRIGVQKTFDYKRCLSPNWYIHPYVEASYYYMRGKCNKKGSNLNVQATALAGVLRFETDMDTPIGFPYFDFGIGGAWFGKREMCGREMDMKFQFEDRLGLGVMFGDKKQFDISYRFVHFSNANLGAKNHGINLHLLVLGYWF